MNIVSKHAFKHLKIMVSTSRLAYVTVSLKVTWKRMIFLNILENVENSIFP